MSRFEFPGDITGIPNREEKVSTNGIIMPKVYVARRLLLEYLVLKSRHRVLLCRHSQPPLEFSFALITCKHRVRS